MSPAKKYEKMYLTRSYMCCSPAPFVTIAKNKKRQLIILKYQLFIDAFILHIAQNTETATPTLSGIFYGKSGLKIRKSNWKKKFFIKKKVYRSYVDCYRKCIFGYYMAILILLLLGGEAFL